MIAVKASEAPELVLLAEQIAQLKNPGLFWDLAQMDDLDRRVLVAKLLTDFEELAG